MFTTEGQLADEMKCDCNYKIQYNFHNFFIAHAWQI